jgi:hypothetical protein
MPKITMATESDTVRASTANSFSITGSIGLRDVDSGESAPDEKEHERLG